MTQACNAAQELTLPSLHAFEIDDCNISQRKESVWKSA